MTDDVREKARETAFHFAGYFNVGEDSERAFRETAEKYVESALSAARNAALEEAAERVNQIYGPEANANDPHVQAVLRCRDNIRALKDKE